MSTPTLNKPFTATAKFYDDAGVERPVDSIDWSATGGASFPTAPGTGPVATGVYSATGPFEITAVAHFGDAQTITVKTGGTVPVPFPTHGEIILS